MLTFVITQVREIYSSFSVAKQTRCRFQGDTKGAVDKDGGCTRTPVSCDDLEPLRPKVLRNGDVVATIRQRGLLVRFYKARRAPSPRTRAVVHRGWDRVGGGARYGSSVNWCYAVSANGFIIEINRSSRRGDGWVNALSVAGAWIDASVGGPASV